MKKKFKVIFMILLSIIMCTGCDALDNNPTKKVEKLLDNYKNQDETILTQLDDVLTNDNTMNDTQKKDYKKSMTRQYTDLTYEVKDETIDGNNATVTVEVEVYDYNKVNNDANTYLSTNEQEFQDENGLYSDMLFIGYKIRQMLETKDRIKYTIDFTVTKQDGVWTVNDLTDEQRQKLHGTYVS